MKRFVFLTMVALVMAVVLASPAWAATYTVDRIDDPDLSTTLSADDCTAAANDCSLRGAITAANANVGDDTIDIGVTGTVNLTGALPDLSSNIDLKGPGADQFTVRRDKGGDYRIFHVTGGSVVSISGITISNGNVGGLDDGGGVLNEGSLTISASTISGNSAGYGAGVHNLFGSLTISASTISGNSAGSLGGGVYSLKNISSQSTTITNSTISGNKATNAGGGVLNEEGLMVINNSTITDNTSGLDGGGVASRADTGSTRTEVLSSIISANTATRFSPDVDKYLCCDNTFLSKGYNLIGDGDATDAFNQTGDTTGVSDPKLGDLAANGGPTQTHALLTGSPAIDAGPPLVADANGLSCPPPQTDQRGISRLQGSACDIGAYEVAVDTTPPKVTETSPLVPKKSESITATFSESAQNVSTQTFFLERKIASKVKTDPPKYLLVDATVTPSTNGLTAVLDPVENLATGVYRVTITTDVTDKADNKLDQDQDPTNGNQPKVWTFTVKK